MKVFCVFMYVRESHMYEAAQSCGRGSSLSAGPFQQKLRAGLLNVEGMYVPCTRMSWSHLYCCVCMNSTTLQLKGILVVERRSRTVVD